MGAIRDKIPAGSHIKKPDQKSRHPLNHTQRRVLTTPLLQFGIAAHTAADYRTVILHLMIFSVAGVSNFRRRIALRISSVFTSQTQSAMRSK